MSENPHQPREYDAVLGGQAPPPVDGVVLGGLEGISKRFTDGDTTQKIEALATLINYKDEGIELLIEALSDSVLTVRATAAEYLQKINVERARLAIANGIIVNPGDRIYSVYESIHTYNHNHSYYELLRSLEDIEARSPKFTPKLVSRHIFKANAESAALSHHNWVAFQDDVCNYFPATTSSYKGNRLRVSLNIIDWCRNNNILIRLPGESRIEFERRCYIDDSANLKLSEENRLIHEEKLKEELNVEFNWCYSEYPPTKRKFEQRCFPNTSAKLKLAEEYQLIYQEWFREEPDLEFNREELEAQVIANLQASQQYELLGQLWLECVGSLAFVHEEIVSQQSYIEVTETS